MIPRRTVLIGDALSRLKELPPGQVDTVITSPPYFRLRDYGVVGQLGQEPHIESWVENLRAICAEVARVLAPHGSLWLNVADSYSRDLAYGAPPKSLLLGPERLVRTLVADGWTVRNKVVWTKPNPLPSPAKDRLTNGHEFVYLLTRRPSYFFDLDAIRQPLTSTKRPWRGSATPAYVLGSLAGGRGGLVGMARKGMTGHPLGKNPGDVWSVASPGFRGAHFATFPPALVRRPLLATCPERVCTVCERPWQRSTERVVFEGGRPQPRLLVPCGCGAPTRRGLVLDPFFGSGTVAQVAEAHGRDWLGIELNPAYLAVAESRLKRRLAGRRMALSGNC